MGWTETKRWNDLGSTSKGQRVAVAAFGARCLRPRRRGAAQKRLVFYTAHTTGATSTDTVPCMEGASGVRPSRVQSDGAAPREASARGGVGSRPGVAVVDRDRYESGGGGGAATKSWWGPIYRT